MIPEDKFKSARCFALPRDVFVVLFESLSPQCRFVDVELERYGSEHFLLLREGNRIACFYMEAKPCTTT